MDRDEEIKNEFIQRAEVERDNLLKEIERLITSVLPGAKKDFENTFSTFIDMARQMNVPFSVMKNAKESEIDQTITNLVALKEKLENLEITEETLLNGTVMDTVQQKIPLVEPLILETKIKINNSCKERFSESLKQKENIKSKISNLKIQRMYLQGKLDSTWKKSEKTELGDKINSLDIELNSLENQLSKLVFKEDISIPRNNGGMPAMPHNTQSQAGQEQDGQEPEDDEGNR